MAPFQAKPRHEGVEEAISAALAAHHALQDLDDQTRVQSLARAEAIADALAQGATLRELAGRLGISAERVRQLAAEAETANK